MEFYGYRKCSTCRNAHKHLQAAGADVPFQDFVDTPPSPDMLRSWIDKKGEGVTPFINFKGTRYRELGLADKSLTDEEWLSLLSTDGKLLKRPVLVLDDQVLVGYKEAEYDAALARATSGLRGQA